MASWDSFPASELTSFTGSTFISRNRSTISRISLRKSGLMDTSTPVARNVKKNPIHTRLLPRLPFGKILFEDKPSHDCGSNGAISALSVFHNRHDGVIHENLEPRSVAAVQRLSQSCHIGCDLATCSRCLPADMRRALRKSLLPRQRRRP